MLSENDLVLEKLAKIVETVNKLETFHFGEKSTDLFTPPTKHEVEGRINTSAILSELEKLNKKIEDLQTTVNDLKK